MSRIRLLGLIILILGIAGIILSLSADQIGLSMFGGENGWGRMNTAGALAGCVLVLAGLIMALRTTSRPRLESSPETITVIGYETPLQASSIPTIVSPEKRTIFLEPRKTVIRIEDN